MISTLKKLGHKRKLNRKGKDKKSLEILSTGDKLKSTAKSSFDLCGEPTPTPPFNPARRHSCFSAFIDTPTTESERPRRGSVASHASQTSQTSHGSSCGGGSKLRRGSLASNGSVPSAESSHARRLSEIAQLDRYVENLKKSADPDNLSQIPNRLCVAMLLKSVLQRRERQYMYEYLHSTRRSSDSDIATKCKKLPISKPDAGLTARDANNNNNSNYDENSNTVVDTQDGHRRSMEKNGNDVMWTSDDSSQDIHSKSIDTSQEEGGGDSDDSKEEDQGERVPGALLEAFQQELSQRSVDSDSELEESKSKHHRYRKRSESRTRRKSIALFPNNYEIY